MMSNTSTLLHLYFKLKIYETSGMEFQIFFSSIMRHIDDDFIGIKPHGNWGDGGNDGCNPKTKHYYQIYAPLASTNPNPIAEFKKAETDYHKLIDKWGEVKGYSFVINDRFTQIQAPLQEKFQKFMTANKIHDGRIICSFQLQKMFMKLDQEIKQDLLNQHYIDDNPSNEFEPTLIGELIKYLGDIPDNDFGFLNGDAPNFDEKIQFNNLSPLLASRLVSDYAEVHKVKTFLDIQGDDVAQNLSKSINTIYKNITSTIPDNEPDKSSLIYFSLIEKLIPIHANKDKHLKRSYTLLVRIIIANYFSTCDVYEDPKRSIAT